MEGYHKKRFLLRVRLNKKRAGQEPEPLFIGWKERYLREVVEAMTWLRISEEFLYFKVFVLVLLWFRQIWHALFDIRRKVEE